ncbi:condensation domain-containing protein [Streptomyces sp. AM 2-1-1]|uniref:condensation domain-containing protein n=1 Tax=Streptomyces sp. AM 2-1-1 TaxID=3028709 RepID=UPI0023BA0DEC|nr:condensation domain-containing protein [Streptomyces sp. AM 2-1-1]WEH43443.1 condensation domain-containing protein [Streptomyces sp. AM 2-1-1]
MPASDQQPHPSAPGGTGLPTGSRAGAVLSVGQERLWFLDQFEPGDPAYTIPLVLRLSGPLSAEALGAALDALFGRHEALRSRFPSEDGRPYVVVGPPAHVPLASRDLRGFPESDVAAYVAEFTNRPFDLAEGPLLRAALFRTGPHAHTFALAVHHIAADGWSLGLMRSELAALYSAHRAGHDAELTDPPSYLEHAAAERAWLDGPEATAALDHWRRLLDGAQPLELLHENPRPELPSSRGAYHTRVLHGLGSAVESFARARRVTPFMVIAAAYQTLLHRCTGQDDFCVGVPTAARTTVDGERTVGYFSSTLVLRADFAGTRSFDAVLRRIRSDWLRALTHGRVPFERLTEEVRQDRDTGRTPVFQTLLTVHTQSGGALGEHRFADLGGHSLLATRVVARIRAAADLGVSLRTLFTHRTCAAFAQAVEAALLAEIDALSDTAAEELLAAQDSPEGNRFLS